MRVAVIERSRRFGDHAEQQTRRIAHHLPGVSLLHPLGAEFLQPREIDAVVKYLFAKAVGRGRSTYDECVDFWGTDTRECEPMKDEK